MWLVNCVVKKKKNAISKLWALQSLTSKAFDTSGIDPKLYSVLKIFAWHKKVYENMFYISREKLFCVGLIWLY